MIKAQKQYNKPQPRKKQRIHTNNKLKKRRMQTTQEGSPRKNTNNITHGRKTNRETRQHPPNELPETTKADHRHLPAKKVSKSNSEALTVI
jgi:hypothetical protein